MRSVSGCCREVPTPHRGLPKAHNLIVPASLRSEPAYSPPCPRCWTNRETWDRPNNMNVNGATASPSHRLPPARGRFQLNRSCDRTEERQIEYPTLGIEHVVFDVAPLKCASGKFRARVSLLFQLLIIAFCSSAFDPCGDK